MSTVPHDKAAIDGKVAKPAEHADVLVIGAGSSGLAAAVEAAERGANVVLVDENPIDPDLFGLDVPLYFGGRMTGAVRHGGQMLEQVFAANPKLAEAMELGVDVRLGTSAWALYTNGPFMQALPEPMVALADSSRSWTCGFNHLILATGARDVVLAFPGWDLPGVMGAYGLRSLIERYAAFAGQRIVIFGSTRLAVDTALLALRHGLEVLALVEVIDVPQVGMEELRLLASAGIPVLTGHRPKRVEGGPDGVQRVVLLDRVGQETELLCDTVCLAIGLVPSVELLNAARGNLTADAQRGGHVPILNGWLTSIPNVYAVGNCAGIGHSEAVSADTGRQAARQALGAEWSRNPAPCEASWSYQSHWHGALTREADASLIVCQCEAVTRGDLLGVRAPRYLGPATPKADQRNIATLIADGPVDQDQIKRLTRACMGVCQARRCREQVAMTLAEAAAIPLAAVALAGYRPPVRPLPLRVLADWQEPPEMTAHWEAWFDIPGQWAPYEDIGTEREFDGPFGGS